MPLAMATARQPSAIRVHLSREDLKTNEKQEIKKKKKNKAWRLFCNPIDPFDLNGVLRLGSRIMAR